MKLFILKILLQRRAKDEGFTLPMVIALGLVMILLGAVNITSANEENLNAITQNSRSDASAIAEVGIARYRELLDKNRILTIYNRNQWTSNNVNGVNVSAQTCNPITAIGTNNGWASNETAGTAFNAANWRAVNLNETVLNRDLNNDGDATDTSVPAGWYKIVDYEYDNDNLSFFNDNDGDGSIDDTTDDSGNFSIVSDANTDDDPSPPAPSPPVVTANSITDENDIDDDGNSDARGLLTVKGRTSNGSEAQIEVEIPIRINTQDMGNLAPALWIGDNTITAADLGTLNISAGNNIVISDGAVTTGGSEADGCRDFASLRTATSLPIISDPREIPPIGTIATTINAAANVLGDDRTNSIPTTGDNSNGIGSVGAKAYGMPSGSTFDEDTDCPTIRDCRYYYNSGNITIDDHLTTDGIARATLYIDGTLDIDPTSNITVGSDVASNYFEIYVDNGQAITIDTTNGNVTINGLIHAPDSTLEIVGNGIVTINGSVWVNDFVNTNATVNISPDESNLSTSVSNQAYEFYTTTNNRIAKPITGSPVNWRTEEVD